MTERELIECPECNGSGRANPDDFDQNYEPCEKCGGSGKIKKRARGRKMEAKDTVMSEEEIIELKAEAYKLIWSHKAHPRFEEEKHLLGRQAEISFKAGQKEVMEWVETHKISGNSISTHFTKFCLLITDDEWQARLKEWDDRTGIDRENS